jgi:hypothetical protein
VTTYLKRGKMQNKQTKKQQQKATHTHKTKPDKWEISYRRQGEGCAGNYSNSHMGKGSSRMKGQKNSRRAHNK